MSNGVLKLHHADIVIDPHQSYIDSHKGKLVQFDGFCIQPFIPNLNCCKMNRDAETGRIDFELCDIAGDVLPQNYTGCAEFGNGVGGQHGVTFLDGKIHSYYDCPAVLHVGHFVAWYKNGVMHRDLGPAKVYGDQYGVYPEYYLDGKKLTKYRWMQRQKKTEHWTTIMGMALGEGRQWKP